MNITQGYIFIKTDYDHECVIVWERSDIKDYIMDHLDFVFVGTCQYNVETREIIEIER